MDETKEIWLIEYFITKNGELKERVRLPIAPESKSDVSLIMTKAMIKINKLQRKILTNNKPNRSERKRFENIYNNDIKEARAQERNKMIKILIDNKNWFYPQWEKVAIQKINEMGL